MTTSENNRVVEIILPRENRIDVLALETLMASLRSERIFSFEISGDANGKRLMVRGGEDTVQHIMAQLRALYDQIEFRPVCPEEDPARANDLGALTAQLYLERPTYLPLRTHRQGDFLEADPMRTLLGAFSGLSGKERVLSQLVLTPAPSNWARHYLKYAYPPRRDPNGNDLSFRAQFRAALAVFGLVPSLSFGLGSLLALADHDWLLGVTAGAFALFLGVFTAAGLYYLIETNTPIDPATANLKVAIPAFNFALRLVAIAPTRERAQELIRRVYGAYQQFDLANANSFGVRVDQFNPSVLQVQDWTDMHARFAKVPRLNVSEIASLWHLPVGEGVQMVNHTLSKRILPAYPPSVAAGILIGHSIYQDQHIPVHLSDEMLKQHSFLIAKTQKGKSTTMAHLTAAAMQRDDMAVVVIDPHRDLMRALVSQVPDHRADDVILVDFADTSRIVGLNVLDMAQGRSADDIVSHLVHVGEHLWPDNWGPRMEDSFRNGMLTLLAANEKLVQRGEPQFSLIDLPRLFELPEFRRRLVKQYVRDSEVLTWWTSFYDRMPESLRAESINPVMTKLHRFSSHHLIRSIIGQPDSTIDLRDVVRKGQILLVNSAAGAIGLDASGLLSAVLIDTITFLVREQMQTERSARRRVLVVIDEFQSIPGVDYVSLLAELQKMGASFILATQSLDQLDAVHPALKGTILANSASLFVFQTNVEDARLLARELDEAVTATDIINLPDYACYVKSQRGRERLPVMYVETLPPAAANYPLLARIDNGCLQYTRNAAEVEEARNSFRARWYGRDETLMKKTLVDVELPRPSLNESPAQPTQDDAGASHASASDSSAQNSSGERNKSRGDASNDDAANGWRSP